MLFFFNDTATTEIYTLSLHDALPIAATSDLSILAIGFKDRDAEAAPLLGARLGGELFFRHEILTQPTNAQHQHLVPLEGE